MAESESKMGTFNIVGETEGEGEFIVVDEIEYPVAGVVPAVNQGVVQQLPKVETLFTRMTLEDAANKVVLKQNPKLETFFTRMTLEHETAMEVSNYNEGNTSTPPFEIPQGAISKVFSTSEWGKPVTLFKAAETGDHNSVLLLMEEMEDDMDLSKTPLRNDCGDSLIHVAAKGGHWEVVFSLLSSFNEDINCQGYRMRTPLHCAVSQGHLDFAEKIVNYGAKVDVKDADGITPLGIAASKGYRHFVQILLIHGARPEEMEFYMATENGRWEIVELMLEKEGVFSPMWRSKEKDPLVVLACKAFQWGIVKRLLEKGASASDCKRDDASALVWASACGYADVVQLLLRHGASSHYLQMRLALLAATTVQVIRAFEPVVPDLVRELRKKRLLFPWYKIV